MGDTRQPLAPALTAEEWECDKDGYREIEIGDLGVWHRDTPNSLGNLMVVWSVSYSEGAEIDWRGRHALAALCLYQQPFGFTHDEALALTSLADHGELAVWATRPDGSDYRYADAIQSAAAKVAALLPLMPPHPDWHPSHREIL